jgi:Lipocalin-like domain
MYQRAPLILTAIGLLVLGLTVPITNAVGQQAKINKAQLVGSWTLVSNTGSNQSPTAKNFGPNDGFATFEANGRFSIQLLLRSDLPKFTSNNRDTGTAEENKAIVQGSITYFGTYSVNEGDGALTLHIERSSFPNWNGIDQKRIIASLSAEELKYTNPTASVGGTAALAWKRAK